MVMLESILVCRKDTRKYSGVKGHHFGKGHHFFLKLSIVLEKKNSLNYFLNLT